MVYNKITPELIAGKNIRFCIPLYQRLFTWPTSQVEQLLDDLRSHFGKNPDKPYYLGMITVVHREGREDRWDLIDGQQRITVLMLLSIGFLLSGRTDSTEEWIAFFDDSNRLYFKGRSQDREFLKYLADRKPSTYRNINMENGLSCIEEYLRKHFSEEGALDLFASRVYRNLTLFVTELPGHYVASPASLNEYFEAMNSSGKSLEQHEILKVDLLRGQDDNDKLRFTRLWNTVSNFELPLIKESEKIDRGEQIRRYKEAISMCREGDFDGLIRNLCSKTNERDSRGSKSIAEIRVEKRDFGKPSYDDREDAIISFPQFLLMILAIHLNEDRIARIHPSKLLDTFRDNPLTCVPRFYQQLVLYRLLMDLYVVRMKYSSSSGYHKLMVKDEENLYHEHERLKQFESMFDVSTEPHRWILPLLKYVAGLDHEPGQAELLAFLMNLDKELNHQGQCPDVSELGYEAKPRYWLWRLDYALWEKVLLEGKDTLGFSNLDAESIRQYEFRQNRSIEHLHPQNESYNDKWSWHDINSLGNLAMISQSFNSAQSNLPVHVKFANLEVQVNSRNLQSIKLYLMYLEAKCSDREWTVETMRLHERKMMKILKESIEAAG